MELGSAALQTMAAIVGFADTLLAAVSVVTQTLWMVDVAAGACRVMTISNHMCASCVSQRTRAVDFLTLHKIVQG